MITRTLSALISASMLLASTAAIAGPDEDYRDLARARAAELRAAGWPKSRCTTGALFFDGIVVAPKGGLLKSDKFITINGKNVENAENAQIIEIFDTFPTDATLSIVVRRDGQELEVKVPCQDIAGYQQTYLTALDLAGKKKWADCIGALASEASDPTYLELRIGCAKVARDRDSYPIQRWVDEYHTSMVEISGIVPSQRTPLAAKVVKARIDLSPTTYKTLVAKISEWDGGTIWKSAQPDETKMRAAALDGLKRQLIDPQSAMIDMPYDFIYGTWRPFLGASSEGFITCGTVNSKNRMGGYVGSKPFVADVDPAGFARYIGMDDPANQYIKSVEFGCAALISKLNYVGDSGSGPTSSGTSTAAVPSMSDELAKLAELHKSGALTDAEYAAAKARILGDT